LTQKSDSGAIATDYYIDRLDDPDFALKIRERNPVSLDDALHISLQLEAWAWASATEGMLRIRLKFMVLVFLSDDVDIRLTHIENDLQKCVESFANVAQQSSQVARQDSQSSVMVNTDADQPLQVTDVAI